MPNMDFAAYYAREELHRRENLRRLQAERMWYEYGIVI